MMRWFAALLMVPALPGIAAAEPPQAPPSPLVGVVHAQGTAHRRLPSTAADISLGIEVEGHDIPTVSRLLVERSQTLLAYLRGQGAQRLGTSGISVDPRTHTAPGGPNTITGYDGRLQVGFHCTAAQAGGLITGSLGHGANTLQSARFAPGEEELEKARRELAVEATHRALDQAQALAEAAGEHVIGVREIDALPMGGGLPAPMIMAPSARVATGVLAPIATEPGERDVEVTVDVKVAIGR